MALFERRPLIEIPLQTMDAATGAAVEGGSAGSMFLLPAKAGTCEMCATTHDPEQPHNAQSLFYGMRFQLEHGRGPTWVDAMAHCDDHVRKIWTDALTNAGVDVAGGAVNPSRKKATPAPPEPIKDEDIPY